MRVIITGGTGLIGKALANHLAKGGHEIIVLSRNPNKTSGLPAGSRVVQWDGRSAEGWGQLADGAGAIVNLAGASIAGDGLLPSPWTSERKKAILESRLNAGRAVVEAIRAATIKPTVLIQSSAVGYYGTSDDATFTEDSPAGNDFLADTCKQWEASTAAVEAMGVRRPVIRTGVVLSTKGGVLPSLSLPYRLFAGGPVGSGRQPLPWIHIDDEVDAIRYLIETPSARGPFNLTAPNPVTNAEFGKAVGKVLRRPHYLPAPGFAFKLAFGEAAILVLEGQRVLPKKLLDAGYAFHFAQVEPALRDIFQTGK
jgi:uncharacterized protein (TIGR01777 family)